MEIALSNNQSILLTRVIYWFSHFMRFNPLFFIHNSSGEKLLIYPWVTFYPWISSIRHWSVYLQSYCNVHAINQFLNWQFKWIDINSLTFVRNWIPHLLWSIPPKSHIMIPTYRFYSCDYQHNLTCISKDHNIWLGCLYPLRIKNDSHTNI